MHQYKYYFDNGDDDEHWKSIQITLVTLLLMVPRTYQTVKYCDFDQCLKVTVLSLAALAYTWFKDTIFNLVRTTVKWYIFVSSDGTLYFQSVTKDDVGSYFCMVTRPDAAGNFQEGKVSEPIPLIMTGAGKLETVCCFL